MMSGTHGLVTGTNQLVAPLSLLLLSSSPIRPMETSSLHPGIASNNNNEEEATATDAEDVELEKENNNIDNIYDEDESVLVDYHHEEPAMDAAEGSGISGKGMWDAWTRSFDTPLLAFLDLLDNAVDASWSLFGDNLQLNYLRGGVPVPLIQIDVDDRIGSGGLIMRNASKYIPPLSEVLQVYKSNKGLMKDSIGENGIGVKHACASLSDLSFIFCKRDMEYLSVGILMKDLQQEKSIILPSFEWHHSVNIPEELEKMCTVTHPHTWGKALEAYGDGDLDNGINQCYRQMLAIQEGEWKDQPNVFTMLLNELKHEGLDSIEDVHVENDDDTYRKEKKTSIEKSRALLTELQKKLPYLYLHLSKFDVKVLKKSISSTYWERRLVELTKFELEIPMEEHWAKIHESLYKNDRVTNIKDPSKIVRFFCGFNPFRASDEDEDNSSDDVEMETDLGMAGGRNVKSASLKVYLYSRQSGRLIKVEHDPRSKYGLGSGSTNYNQGLTIIVDDYNGTIPLNPTKQDTSYGQSSHGQIHSDNIQEWTAAIIHFYWTYHFETIAGESKRALSEACKSRKENIKQLMASPAVYPLSGGNFIEYSNLQFKLVSRRSGPCIRTLKASRNNCIAKFAGSDDMSNCTLIRLDEDAAGIILQDEALKRAERGSQKRHRSSVQLDDDESDRALPQHANGRAIADNRLRHSATKAKVTKLPRRQVVATAREDAWINELNQEIVQLKKAFDEQAQELSHVSMQKNNEKVRADKLEQDIGFLRAQNNHLLEATGDVGYQSAEVQSLRAQLEEASRKNHVLRQEIATLKANGASSGSGEHINSKEEIIRLNKQICSLLQQVQYYKSDKDSARQQIKLLNEEKDRMEARVQQLESTQFDLM
jgi:hypothetical protein